MTGRPTGGRECRHRLDAIGVGRRIWALILRQLYLHRRSWIRLIDLAYWPLLDLLLFGFLAVYLGEREGSPAIVGFIVGGYILWDLFFRIQQGISLTFLTELWARNFINLFITPLTMGEFLAAMMGFGLLKITVTVSLITGMAYGLYHFNLFALGPSLVPFFAALILFGWAVGTVVTAVILRYGQSAENLAWSLAFLFQPFGAVFFPMSVYPGWLRSILFFFPLPHVFEGMRAVLAGGPLPGAHLVWAFVLDALYLALAFAFFGHMFRRAREEGALLKIQD